jgi:acetoin utilization deacetylase AcuC-like enzyme
VKVFACDHLAFPLPADHRFPLAKYALLRQALLARGTVSEAELSAPQLATDEQILRVHDSAYLHKVQAGQLTPREIRRLGLPWSPELVRRARCSAGGTIDACRAALEEGVAVNLGGGTHHASRDQAQGFCLFNDVVMAARAMQAEGRAERVVVLDCDVHQGNGTAALAAGDPTVFTFSIHNEQNFPLRKEPSDLDIGLGDGTGDAAYLEALEEGIAQAIGQAQADLAVYLAGADPYEGDLLGRFALTKEGLARRDDLVFERCWRAGLPVATLLAGGYARQVQDVVDINWRTVQIASAWARRLRAALGRLSPP